MATRALTFFACLFVVVGKSAPLPDTHRVHEGGGWREYRVALDEVHEKRQVRVIPAERDAEAIRAKLKGNAAADLVLYPKDGPRDEESRRLLTHDVALQVAPGANPKAMVEAAGAVIVRTVKGVPGWWLVRSTGGAGRSLEVAATLRRQPGVLAAEPQLARQQTRKLTPNDPLFSDEWHLENTGQDKGTPGVDAHLKPAWDIATGKGVRLAIVDDGLENTHPDLAPHYRADLSHDFNFDDADPSPPPFLGDSHGTSCAGVAAAAGNNGIGVCGVAFEADLVGLRLIAAPTTDLDEAEAFAYHVGEQDPKNEIEVKSNSWGPFDDARRLEGPGPLARAALHEATQTGRNGRGTVFLWAAGNGRQTHDDSNFDGYANLRETIAIGAYTNNDKQPFYAETGSNIVVVAPSNGGPLGITTTDRQGNDGYNFKKRRNNFDDRDYTNNFGGTSSACPLAAGVVALMLEARPELGWRDVQDILIRTARQTLGMVTAAELSDPVTNAAGLKFSRRFGAGLIDAAAAVAAAKTQKLLGPDVSFAEENPTSIPIEDGGTLTEAFNFSNAPLKVEHVVLTVDISHAARGQLEIKVKSPSGTENIIAPARLRDRGKDYRDWSFMSVHFWGEQANAGNGFWTVTVTDTDKGTSGFLNKVRLELFGTPTDGHVQLVKTEVTQTSNDDLIPQPGEKISVEVTLKNDGSETIEDLNVELLSTGGVSNPSAPASCGTLAPGESATATFEFDAPGPLGSQVVGTLRLTDAAAPLGTATFSLLLGTPGKLTSTVGPTLETPKFPRSTGNANIYPCTVKTSGAPPGSVITGVRLHLGHAVFQRSGDIDMLLVGPGLRTMIPMSDAGFSADDASFTLSDTATLPLPATSYILDGVFRPTNYGPNDAFPSPAPKGPYGSNFAVFNGADPNGDWSLYIRDDGGPGRGALGSWWVEVDYVQ